MKIRDLLTEDQARIVDLIEAHSRGWRLNATNAAKENDLTNVATYSVIGTSIDAVRASVVEEMLNQNAKAAEAEEEDSDEPVETQYDEMNYDPYAGGEVFEYHEPDPYE